MNEHKCPEDGCDFSTDTQRGLSLHITARHENSEPWHNHEKLKRMYCDKLMSPPEIAEKLDCTPPTIHKELEKAGVDKRNMSEATILRDKDQPVGMSVTNAGHVLVRHNAKSEGYERASIHRLVAVAEYGFDAVKEKHVHHKNNIPWDNRRDNLELMTKSDHHSHHALNINRDNKGRFSQ